MTGPELLAAWEPKPTQALTHPAQLGATRFTSCGKWLLGAGYDGGVHRWDLTGEAPETRPPLVGPHHGWLTGLECSAAPGRCFSADSWGALAAWDYAASDAKPLWTVPEAHDGWIRALAVSPDGQTLATAGNDLAIRLWSAADGKPLGALAGHTMPVFSLAFHPDGGSLASGDWSARVRRWSLAERKSLGEFEMPGLYLLNKMQDCGGARTLAFNAAGDRLAVGGQKDPQGGFAGGTPAVVLLEWPSGKVLGELVHGVKDDGFTYDARWHPAGFLMGVSCAFPGKGHFWFWLPGEEKPFFLGKGLTNGRSVCLHPDGKRLLVLISVAANGNGRSLKDGAYEGGSAKLQWLEFPAAAG